jgi:uncharacterized Zn finger protein
MSAPSVEVQAKAARYLLTGKVKVDYADVRSFTALVSGTRETPYAVMWHTGHWRCDCPARATCAHMLACQMIWAPVLTAVPQTVPGPWDAKDPFSLVEPVNP